MSQSLVQWKLIDSTQMPLRASLQAISETLVGTTSHALLQPALWFLEQALPLLHRRGWDWPWLLTENNITCWCLPCYQNATMISTKTQFEHSSCEAFEVLYVLPKDQWDSQALFHCFHRKKKKKPRRFFFQSYIMKKTREKQTIKRRDSPTSWRKIKRYRRVRWDPICKQ